jgi:hypothetical protein
MLQCRLAHHTFLAPSSGVFQTEKDATAAIPAVKIRFISRQGGLTERIPEK